MKTKGKAQDIYSLTPLQEGMLFHALHDAGSAAYFNQASFRIQGLFNPQHARQALNYLMQRHQVLRTNFVYQGLKRPFQVVLKERAIDFTLLDGTHLLSEARQAEFIEQTKANDRARGFDLAKEVLMRVIIVQLPANTYEFIWSHHHILFDGWCKEMLLAEFNECYDAITEGRDPVLPPVKQYRDYIKWLDTKDHATSKTWWATYLQQYQQAAHLPYIKPQNPKTPKPQNPINLI